MNRITRIRSRGWLPWITVWLATVAVFLALRLYLAAVLLLIWCGSWLLWRTR